MKAPRRPTPTAHVKSTSTVRPKVTSITLASSRGMRRICRKRWCSLMFQATTTSSPARHAIGIRPARRERKYRTTRTTPTWTRAAIGVLAPFWTLVAVRAMAPVAAKTAG